MSLEEEIAVARLEVSADTISMAISELTNLYKESILEIRPEFQRLYRWNEEQKSRLIESILLGIPLPSIFVSQSDDGKWELVDGLQRVSTLLELQGLLVDADGTTRAPLRLRQTKFLPSLDDHSWDGTGAADPLTEAQKLDIRLARLDLRVIKRGSDPKAKFDLFQRLNSFGSTLEPQEIRSALIAATNSECLAWLTRLAASEDFRSCVSLSERLVDVQYDVELVLRFMMLHSYDTDGPANRLGDFSAKLDDWSIDLAANFACRHEELQEVFLTTFGTLATHGAEDVFRKWNGERFRGPFLNTAFEVIALGTGYHVANGSAYRTDPLDASRELWGRDQMRTRFATGLATQDRFQLTLPLGRQLMSAPVG